MSRKRVVVAAVAATVAIGAGIGAATFASFSSEVKSAPVSAKAATMYLNGVAPVSGAPWAVDNMAPGVSQGTPTAIIIENKGTLGAKTLTLTLTANGKAGLDSTNPLHVPDDLDDTAVNGTPGSEYEDENAANSGAGITADSELPATLEAELLYFRFDSSGNKLGSTPITASGYASCSDAGIAPNCAWTFTLANQDGSAFLAAGEKIELDISLRPAASANNKIQGDEARVQLTAKIEQ